MEKINFNLTNLSNIHNVLETEIWNKVKRNNQLEGSIYPIYIHAIYQAAEFNLRNMLKNKIWQK